jgi:N-acetylmuramoyl-L-alanine amidase
MRLPLLLVALVLALGAVLTACRSSRELELPPKPARPIGRSIVVAGERFEVGAPVVLWTDENGYDATQTSLRFEAPPEGTKTPAEGELRYKPGRTEPDGDVRVRPGSRDLLSVQSAVDMFVLHYDVCGTSRQCFKVLHDRRGLSVHFMIDVDGTIYQTLDLADTAWHASQVNWRSVGVEIANIGSYSIDDKKGMATLDEWYPSDGDGPYVRYPAFMKETGIRTPDFVARPARRERVIGPMQNTTRAQFDFTREQYDSLPRIEPDAPRDAAGRILTVRMDEEAESSFHGIVGHYHVSKQKQDPGPAFDWDVFLTRVRSRLSAGGNS